MAAATKRDNLLSLIRRKGYDETPFDFGLCPILENTYRERTGSGLACADYFGFSTRDLPPVAAEDGDLARFYPYHGPLGPDTHLDEWGVGHRSTPTSMHMTQMLCPLKDADSAEQIAAYPMPSYRAEGNEGIAEAARAVHARGLAAVGNMQCTIWEASWYMRGMENLMMDMMSDSPMAGLLLGRVEERSVAKAEIYARAGADILYLGDDIGMQRSIMMGLEMYREWLKPALARVIAAARRAKPDIIVFYHSCGYVEPFIPDLIEAGIDVLNPVQPECMDFEKIHGLYGDVLSFHGAVGTQTTMPFGSEGDVRDAVRRYLRIAGSKGGLYIAPTHILEPEVPWENIMAFVAACREHSGA
ncbi:MAG: uroporphyrinogen decarboxylase family protein [Clostridiales bacterium]|jgi:uroporphyrinogen decarboxylase|nr:uroporphyrinogen decarboxylase family protein [Clostridiales bacterium]